MGYRSDVGIVLNGAAEARLQDEIAKLTGDTRTEVESLLGYADTRQVDSRSGDALYYFTWIKWYEERSDVGFIARFLDSLDEDEYLFVRVGESNDDSEERGNYYANAFDMSLVREIEFASPVLEVATTANG